MSNIEDIKEKLLSEKPAPPVRKAGLSTSQTLLNLALTGNPGWGFDKGCYYLLVGSSGAAKTFICFHALAEASINPEFDDFDLIYNEPEMGARFNVRKFFGQKLQDRLIRLHSKTIEEMYFDLDDRQKAGKPFVYVIDSETALGSDYGTEKFEEHKAAFSKGKSAAGDFGDGKAKVHSRFLRGVVNGLADSGSIFIVVSQSRDKIGFGTMPGQETRAGGRALTFYATNEIWFKVNKPVKKTVHGVAREIGTEITARVKKNRDTGRKHTIEVHHYPTVGLDDIGSCIQYLVDEKHWKSAKDDGGGKITAHDLGLEGPREKLASLIEQKGLEGDLRRIVVDVWQDVEEECTVRRKNRYQ